MGRGLDLYADEAYLLRLVAPQRSRRVFQRKRVSPPGGDVRPRAAADQARVQQLLRRGPVRPGLRRQDLRRQRLHRLRLQTSR